jgi:hypothetical protein
MIKAESILRDVKRRLGISYSEPEKDAEVLQMIGAAIMYFRQGGWAIPSPSPLVIEAVVLYCKMAESADPAAMQNHPVLISYIAPGRVSHGGE